MTRTAALISSVVLICSAFNTAATAGTAPVPGDSRLISGSAQELLSSCRADIEKARAGRTALLKMKTPRDAVAALEQFDNIGLIAGNAMGRAGISQMVLPSKESRDAAEICQQEGSTFLTDLSLDREVYDTLAALDARALDLQGKRLLERTLLDYRRGGIDKDEVTKARIRQLSEELVKAGQEFSRNIADDVRTVEFDPADLDGLPEDYRKAHPAGPNGKVKLTTNNTDYVPFMRYATNAKGRETFLRTYNRRGYPQNMKVLDTILQKRHALAGLVGYPNYAEYYLADKMAGNERTVADFIEKISKVADARMRADYAELLNAKKQIDPLANEIMPWDVAYLTSKVRSEKYAFDPKLARPYFEYSRVKQGLLDITSRLYGISYKPVPDAVVWHKDVEVYDVYDVGKLLGRIYFDQFPRDNKYKHYATGPLAFGKAGVKIPEAVLVCNFPKPGNDPALMEYEDVQTFFHEYGHLLHFIFAGHNRWSGPALDFDFVEVPSQLMEEWARDPGVLQGFARHYQTNEPIPAAMIEKMRRANEFGKGLTVRSQMTYAALSLNYHNRDPKDLDTTKMLDETWKKYLPYPRATDTYMQTSFGHLDDYAAGYYTYMWSLVIAKDVFSPFKSGGLMNRDVAARYRKNVLEVFGTKPATEQVKNFLGRDFSFKAYEDWLNTD